MQQEAPLRLLALGGDGQRLNKLISSLRRQGTEINVTALSRPDELDKTLQSKAWELLLAFQCHGFPAERVLTVYRDTGVAIPLLIAVQDINSLPNDVTDGHGNIELVPEKDTARLLQAIQLHGRYYRESRNRHRLERQVLSLEKQQQSLMDDSSHAIALLQKELHLYCNDSYAGLLGCRKRENLMDTSILNLVVEKDRKRFGKLLSSARRETASITVGAGTSVEAPLFTFTLSPALWKGHTCIQVKVTPAGGNPDYSSRKQAMQERDLLTRLENLPVFTTRIETAISAAINDGVDSTLLVIRIDRFRQVMETLGKTATHRVLHEIGEFLVHAINKPFSASKLEDDEFGILLYDCDPGEGIKLAEFIRNTVNGSLSGRQADGFIISTTAGIAAINGHTLDANDMINRARINLGTSRGKVPEAATCMPMAARLSEALANNAFRLRFQPLVAFQGDGADCYEVVVRLVDKEGNESGPDSFMQQAGICNLAGEIDRQVIKATFHYRQELQERKFRLLITVSGNTLVDLTILSWLTSELLEQNIPPEQLVFLISEIDLHSNKDAVRAFCETLEKPGFKYAFTHFGSALDPVATLTAFRPEMVRLDENLFRDILYSRSQQDDLGKLVRAIHRHKVNVSASGLEDLEMLPVFQELGIDHIQGNCVQAPGPQPDFIFPREEKITRVA